MSNSSDQYSNDGDTSESSQSPSSGNSQSRGKNDATGISEIRKSPSSSTTSRNTSHDTISEDIPAEGEGDGGSSVVDPFTKSVMNEESEERSFRMLLPSESHRRSSLGQRSRRTSSPASDQSKQSSISGAYKFISANLYSYMFL